MTFNKKDVSRASNGFSNDNIIGVYKEINLEKNKKILFLYLKKAKLGLYVFGYLTLHYDCPIINDQLVIVFMLTIFYRLLKDDFVMSL